MRAASAITNRSGLPGALIFLVSMAVPFSPLAALGQRLLGVDVAQFQGDIDWPTVYDNGNGRVFAFIRATHGSLNDTKFATNMPAARDAGVIAGAYHYAVPVYDPDYDLPGARPDVEADRFLARARDYITIGYLRPMLDLELGGGVTPVGANNLANWANAWLDIVERETGVEPIVYCNSNYAKNYLYGGTPSLANRTLWIADWTHPANAITAQPIDGTGIWSSWVFWQYCNYGNTDGHPSVPGIPARVDLDVFNGTLNQLQNYVIAKRAIITRSPSTLSQSMRQRTSAPNQSFTIRNTGTGGMVYRVIPNRVWLSVSPDTGFVKTNTQTIAVSYSAADLPVGTHTCTIAITADLATNSPQNVEVTLEVRPIPGDFDGNGNIDVFDAGILFGCLTGANQGPPTGNCAATDLDGDGDVDQSDFARLQTCLSGTGIPADPYCAP